jgi:PTH2 family peptidyl-tRNA hydrolase
MEPKQIIVMRKDLNMRKGKMIAQGAHAAMRVMAEIVLACVENPGSSLTQAVPTVLRTWLQGRFTKICVYVNSEAELKKVYETAKAAGVLCALIEDAGLTEFHGVVTPTCCAIGPDYPDKIDPITGHLPLL